jgi:hypothetical protein
MHLTKGWFENGFKGTEIIFENYEGKSISRAGGTSDDFQYSQSEAIMNEEERVKYFNDIILKNVDWDEIKRDNNTAGSFEILSRDEEIPMTMKFEKEIRELIFARIYPVYRDRNSNAKIRNEISKICDEVIKIINLLVPPADKLDGFKDFDDMRTQKGIDILKFEIWPAWKNFPDWGLFHPRENVALKALGASLTFSKDIESINLYNANYYVMQAVLRAFAKRGENHAKLKEQGVDLRGFDRDPEKHNVLYGTYLLDSDRGEKTYNFCSYYMTVGLLIFLKMIELIHNRRRTMYSVHTVNMDIVNKSSNAKQKTKYVVKLEYDDYRKVTDHKVLDQTMI